MPDVRGSLLPVYFVADESSSMTPWISQLSDGLASLHSTMLQESMAAAKVRLCVLGFSDSVICHLDLTDLRYESTMPRFAPRGMTNYGAAFAELRDRMPDDIKRLKGEGYLVHRPAVFFLTDGQPTDGDGWKPTRSILVDKATTSFAPNILAFGIGQAQAGTILELATRQEFAYVTAVGVDVGRAIAEFVKTLTQSLVLSGQAIADGSADLTVKKPASDTFSMAVDLV